MLAVVRPWAELGWTCTTPVREVGGTGWVGSLATAAMWLARPSVRLAVESDFICCCCCGCC